MIGLTLALWTQAGVRYAAHFRADRKPLSMSEPEQGNH